MNKQKTIIVPCPNIRVIAVHAGEVDQFFNWLDHQVLDFVKANNRYVKPDQIAQFLTEIERIKGDINDLLTSS